MIAVDSSALVAVALREAGYEAYREIILAVPCIVGVAQLVETHMVLTGRGYRDPGGYLDTQLSAAALQPVPLDLVHFHAARRAFDRYGKGRGHPAQLNFGDCLSYAVAKVLAFPCCLRERIFG